MSIFTLKIIALLTMILDHIGAYIQGTPEILRCIGRISAPLFLFCSVQGYKNTAKKQKYIWRIYIFSIFMGIVDAVFYVNANFIRIIFLTVVIIALIDSLIQKNQFAKRNIVLFVIWQVIWGGVLGYYFLTYYIEIPESILFILLPALGSPLFMEYGLFFVILGICIYYFGNSKKILNCIYVIITGITFLLQNTAILSRLVNKIAFCVQNIYGLGEFVWQMADLLCDGLFDIDIRFLENSTSSSIQWMMILALPLFLRYNGEKGRNLKWIFYIMYPANIILLRILGMII